MGNVSKYRPGEVVRAQIGNPGEDGYRANCEVKVLAVRESFPGFFLYLAHPVDRPCFIVEASEAIDPVIKGDLYATNGRWYGPGHQSETYEEAVYSLGF